MEFWSYRRRKILALLTFFSLAFLLVLHVRWVFKAATLEEEIFNQRVAIALKEARDEIAGRLGNGIEMNQYLCGKAPHHDHGSDVKRQLDSIISSRLRINNIHLRYTFRIADNYQVNSMRDDDGCYCQSLSGLLPIDGVSINVDFPERTRYVVRQIGGMFVVSVLFILFVAISFLILLKLYNRERMVMARTVNFINNMVHEFNTPLSNIRLATALIRKRSSADSKLDDYLNIISKEHGKLVKHVDDILTASTPGVINCGGELVDLLELTSGVVDYYQSSISAVGGVLSFVHGDGKFIVKGNHRQFEIVWMNLIDNAVKYSVSAPNVKLSLDKQDGVVRFVVEDSGIGIAKGELKYIFEQYYRISSGDLHQVKGFGLGLYFVRTVIEAAGGKVYAESSQGKGSCFIVELKEVKTDE